MTDTNLNKVELASIVEQLKYFGCNTRDAAVYVHCLKIGPSSVQEISRGLKQNRVTIHDSLERLIEAGLITETRQKKRRLLVAEGPDVLYRLLQKKTNELQTMESNLEYVIGLLGKVQPTHDHDRPSIKFYEGVKGFKFLLEETLSARGEILIYSNVDRLSKLIGPDYLEDYFRRRSDLGIHTRLIFPPCDFANRVNKKAKRYKIRIRLLPPEFSWRSAIFSWNNCISLKSFSEERLTCTIVENDDIAHFFRTVIFELSWAQARPIKPVS